MSDYYQTLGVDKTATSEDIKKAYRKLAHQHHPDKGGDEKKFKEINEAYQVLSNQEKRAQYDQFGKTFDGTGGFNTTGGFDFSGAGFDMNFGIDDLFESFFGGFNKKHKEKNRGEDIQLVIDLELKDTLGEVAENIILSKMVECKRCASTGAEPGTPVKECFSCGGTGYVQQMKKTIFGTITKQGLCPECRGQGKTPDKPCNVCNGEGRIKEEEQIKVSIPAGIDTGQTLRFEGKGEAGRRGGMSGDLYLRIHIKPHSVFRRKGDDLLMKSSISLSTAALGGEVDIPTLDNKKISLKIPQGTETGKVFRVTSKGIPHFKAWGRGDIYVETKIEVPKKINKKQKDLLEKLKKEGM